MISYTPQKVAMLNMSNPSNEHKILEKTVQTYEKKSFEAVNVEGQEHCPLKVAILAAFLFYRYKFVSQGKVHELVPIPV